MMVLADKVQRHWFWALLPVLVACAFLLTRTVDWPLDGGTAEAVLLFDWCVTVPTLYALCYHRRMPAKRLAVRVAGLAFLGVVFAGWMVPEASHDLITRASGIRTLGMVVLALIELRIVVAAVKLAYDRNADAEALAAKTEMPLFVARLMALEARFWKAVWRFIRRR